MQAIHSGVPQGVTLTFSDPGEKYILPDVQERDINGAGENIFQKDLQPVVIYTAGGKNPSPPAWRAHGSLGKRCTPHAKHGACF